MRQDSKKIPFRTGTASMRNMTQSTAQKFWLALLQANRMMNQFRARFIGKADPCAFLLG